MAAFAALDVSKKSTSIHIVDEKGVCLWRGKTSPTRMLWPKHCHRFQMTLPSLALKPAVGRPGFGMN